MALNPKNNDSDKDFDEFCALQRRVIELLGEDPNREGLLKTPERVAKSLRFLTKGYDEDPVEILRGATFREDYRQMVIVRDIDFFSLCEHHMLPFFRQSSRGLHPQQIHNRTKQNSSRCGGLCTKASSSGAFNHTNQAMHPGYP